MKFVAYINQTDDYGCDQTIACGKVLWELKAQAEKDALSELKEKMAMYLVIGTCDLEYDLERVVLYEINNAIEVPTDQWRKDWHIEHEKRIKARNLTEEQEKLEYIRLKRKYG